MKVSIGADLRNKIYTTQLSLIFITMTPKLCLKQASGRACDYLRSCSVTIWAKTSAQVKPKTAVNHATPATGAQVASCDVTPYLTAVTMQSGELKLIQLSAMIAPVSRAVTTTKTVPGLDPSTHRDTGKTEIVGIVSSSQVRPEACFSLATPGLDDTFGLLFCSM